MFCCEERCIQTNFSFICRECGRERRSFQQDMFLPGYNRCFSSMNPTLYSRRYRFLSLLQKACGHNSGPASSDPVWEKLEKGAPYHTITELQKVLSQTPFKNKRYDSLPCFSRVFLGAQIAVPPNVVQKIMRSFDKIEQNWRKSGVKRFFSYYYLLEILLSRAGYTDCLKFCKKLNCSKRRTYYDELLESITQRAPSAGVRHPKTVSRHSKSECARPKNPQQRAHRQNDTSLLEDVGTSAFSPGPARVRTCGGGLSSLARLLATSREHGLLRRGDLILNLFR